MTKRKRLPVWYRMFIERRIKKLEIALAYIDEAECGLTKGFVNYSRLCLNAAKTVANVNNNKLNLNESMRTIKLEVNDNSNKTFGGLS